MLKYLLLIYLSAYPVNKNEGRQEFTTTNDPMRLINSIMVTLPPVVIPLNIQDAVTKELSTRSRTMTSNEVAQTAQTIYRLASELGHDPLLILAVIRIESNFNHLAASYVGAEGLMQVMPPTARWTANRYNLAWPDGHSFDPVINIKLGIHYLDYLYKEFKNMKHALTAYNRGPEATRYILDHNNGELPISIDEFYSSKVLGRYEYLKEKYADLR